MNKFILLIVLMFIVNACSYEPILLKKNYDFEFSKIVQNSVNDWNEVLEKILL